MKVKKAGFFDPAVQFLIFLTLFVIPLPLRAYMTPKEIEGDVTEHLLELLPFFARCSVHDRRKSTALLWGYYSRFAEAISRAFTRTPHRRHFSRASHFLSVCFRYFFWSN